MLILTRRIGETIMIGDNVAMTVLGINGKQVRIGIDAPADVKVHREEIYLRIQQENSADDSSIDNDNRGNLRAAPTYEQTLGRRTPHEPVISVRQRTRFSLPGMG